MIEIQIEEEVLDVEVAGAEGVYGLPRIVSTEPCSVCGAKRAVCHLCARLASHFVDIERGTLFLCPRHRFVAHAWQANGLGEYGAYAPTDGCVCDPWRYGSP